MAIIKSGDSTDQLTIDPISKAARVSLYTADGLPVNPISTLCSDLGITAVGVSGASVTATLPAVALNFHFITFLQIQLYNVANRSGTATPITVTTTNLPGNPAFLFNTQGAGGEIQEKIFQPAQYIRSTVDNTVTTIVCPVVTNVIWRINVWYKIATI